MLDSLPGGQYNSGPTGAGMNRSETMSSYVSYLDAAIDGTRLPARQQHTLHEGRPIWVRYDLDAVSRAMDKKTVTKRAPTLWRYKKLLPVENESEIVSLGEGMTPLLRCDRLGGSPGLNKLFIKDESQMPTGSFKDRSQTVAITMAKWFGVKKVAIPTAGNAGGSMAAYAARAGMEAYVFMRRMLRRSISSKWSRPADTPISSTA